MKKQFFISDIDGVLLDSTARYKTRINHKGLKVINLNHWRKNEHLSAYDKPIKHNIEKVLQARKNGYVIVLATARVLYNDNCYRLLYSQLGFKPDHIIYRKPNNSISGTILKITGLNAIFEAYKQAGYSEFFGVVYEDNLKYLNGIISEFPFLTGIFVPSKQGY